MCSIRPTNHNSVSIYGVGFMYFSSFVIGCIFFRLVQRSFILRRCKVMVWHCFSVQLPLEVQTYDLYRKGKGWFVPVDQNSVGCVLSSLVGLRRLLEWTPPECPWPITHHWKDSGSGVCCCGLSSNKKHYNMTAHFLFLSQRPPS